MFTKVLCSGLASKSDLNWGSRIHRSAQLKAEKFRGITYTSRALTVLKRFVYLVISHCVSMARASLDSFWGLWRWWGKDNNPAATGSCLEGGGIKEGEGGERVLSGVQWGTPVHHLFIDILFISETIFSDIFGDKVFFAFLLKVVWDIKAGASEVLWTRS